MVMNYDITKGNLWALIVIFIGFIPTMVARAKKMIVS
jgi:hypothetical protein